MMVPGPEVSKLIKEAADKMAQLHDRVAELETALSTTRNDALEEAALRIDCNCNEMCMFADCPKFRVDAILALKSKDSPHGE